ncbi:COG3650 family protein [Phenylobacterium sp.]|uniref:COG3650 family protein n=1 Tax=Phenylobacterium sp. TaxID=1871053 RepID=UPI0035ADD280
MRALPILPVLFLVSACNPQAPDGAAAPPPADAPEAAGPLQAAPPSTIMDLSQPLLARGTEPFWAVRIEGTKFTLMRAGEPEKVFEAPGAQITPGRATWQAKAPDGDTLDVTLYVSDCSDGMSDLRYPMAAEVANLGRTLNGCAAKISELPREGAQPKG